jgi:hypothetical protein
LNERLREIQVDGTQGQPFGLDVSRQLPLSAYSSTTTIMNTPSPFSPFLNTNYVPSDIEMGVIKSLVKGEEAEAAVLAAQILEAKQALGVLEERHAIHRKFIEDHTMLLSPIRRIPVDVLTLIFLTC